VEHQKEGDASRFNNFQTSLAFPGTPQNIKIERVKGIEPSSAAWEAAALPLSYTRDDANRSEEARFRRCAAIIDSRFAFSLHRGSSPHHAWRRFERGALQPAASSAFSNTPSRAAFQHFRAYRTAFMPFFHKLLNEHSRFAV
jgi:hypothetical protein